MTVEKLDRAQDLHDFIFESDKWLSDRVEYHKEDIPLTMRIYNDISGLGVQIDDEQDLQAIEEIVKKRNKQAKEVFEAL